MAPTGQLQQLLEVYVDADRCSSTEVILQTVCRGIRAALGFEKVSIELLETETGMLRSRASCSRQQTIRAFFSPGILVSAS